MTTQTFVRTRTTAFIAPGNTLDAARDQYNSIEAGYAGDGTHTYQCRIVAFYPDPANSAFYIIGEATYVEVTDPTQTLPELL